MRVAAFTKYGQRAASTRQRVLQYLPELEASDIHVEFYPLLDDAYVKSLDSGASYSKLSVLSSYLRRLSRIIVSRKPDLVWVYGELFPFLPASFERLAFRFGAPVVYDFDDAFFIPYENLKRPLMKRLLQGKLDRLMRDAAICCCGNAYLEDYAKQQGARTMILPTVVDIEKYRPRAQPTHGEPATIGWIGSPTTWPYFRPLLPLLQELAERYGSRIRVVGAGARAVEDAKPFPACELVEWREETEVADVQAMDIGVMPLPDETWTRGKSGYKLVQYMACGVPVVASPVGVNSEIVAEGVNGFLASSQEEWRTALTSLLQSPDLRERMGNAGRERVAERYSLQVQAPRLIDAMLRARTR